MVLDIIICKCSIPIRLHWGRNLCVYFLTKKKHQQSFDCWCFFSWWTWRESNPRPNKEIISLLHVYLCLNFRAQARPKPPTCTLSSVFHLCREANTNYPRFSCTSLSLASERRPLGNVSFQHLVSKLSRIYCTSIKQQERSYFRQLYC